MKNKFSFSREDDGSLSLEGAVFQALGAASMAWGLDNVFDSTFAEEVGNALVAFIKEDCASA